MCSTFGGTLVIFTASNVGNYTKNHTAKFETFDSDQSIHSIPKTSKSFLSTMSEYDLEHGEKKKVKRSDTWVSKISDNSAKSSHHQMP